MDDSFHYSNAIPESRLNSRRQSEKLVAIDPIMRLSQGMKQNFERPARKSEVKIKVDSLASGGRN